VVDIENLFSTRPGWWAGLMRELLGLFESGELRPLPLTEVPIAQVREAFRTLAAARHVGKLVAVCAPPPAEIAAEVDVRDVLRPEGAYLITGAFGGLGMEVARWLAEHGARHLILLGRQVRQHGALEQVRRAGVEVTLVEVDVGEREALERALAELERSAPPIRGVIHAAAALDDGTLPNLDEGKFRRVFAPKADGAWTLHRASLRWELDFFILFSAGAALLGPAGQANYAAANAFLDALARHRRGQGLPAVSIQWGPWSEVGMAARQERGGRAISRELGSLSPRQGLEALGLLLCEPGAPVVAVLPFHSVPAGAVYSELSGPAGRREEVASLRQVIAQAPESERAELLWAHVREQVAGIAGVSPGAVGSRTAFTDLGLDSLMGLELKNKLEGVLGLTLPATLVFQCPTLEKLVPFLLERLGLGAGAPAEAPAPPAHRAPPEPEPEPAEVEALSEEELKVQLAEKLALLEQEGLL
jgi:NAD(P)-dependent dehydrogenase (short-subunit alcohol dehydrogenase family)/acyl carrier protein